MKQARLGTAFVVTGPSGAGKTTLLDDLLTREPDLHFSVSWTTRSPRAGEVDGVDYTFVTEDQFRSEVNRPGGMLEWAQVHKHLYGTPASEVGPRLVAGQDVILDIDVQGAARVRASGLDACFVFVLPPSIAEQRSRLVARESETPESLAIRVGRAVEEVACWPTFDYVIVNDDLETAKRDLHAIIISQRLRVCKGRRPRGWLGELPADWNANE